MLTLIAPIQQLIATTAVVTLVPILSISIGLLLRRTLRAYWASWNGERQNL